MGRDVTTTLTVERDELLARAAELERELPLPPATNPVAPCALSFIGDATEQLAMNANAIRLYLKAWDREVKRLAKSLRNAAEAYDAVDEAAAAAIADGTAMSAVSVGQGAEDGELSALSRELDAPVGALAIPERPYYSVRDAADQIGAPDQGAAFSACAKEWEAFQRRLQTTSTYFRPFQIWDGTTQMAVEANFDMQRGYMYSMVELCLQLVTQANNVVAAHKWAVIEHPVPYDLVAVDNRWNKYCSTPEWHVYLPDVIKEYEYLQKKSEEVLAEYARKAGIPLSAFNPTNPPPALRIDPPYVPPPIPGPPDDGDPDDPDDGDPDEELPGDPDDEIPGDPDDELPGDPDDELPGDPDDGDPDDELPGDPDDELPSDPDIPDGELPPLQPGDDPPDAATPKGPRPDGAGAGTPALPPNVAQPDMPSLDDPELTAALDELKAMGADVGAGLKPASLGGGGGVPGMPSLPLQPAAEGEAMRGGAPAGAAGRDLGNLAKAPTGGPGGGGMGMAPMAPGAGAAGQGGDGKSKRPEGTDEALYVEDRDWTEGVIGRRRKDITDGKDNK